MLASPRFFLQRAFVAAALAVALAAGPFALATAAPLKTPGQKAAASKAGAPKKPALKKEAIAAAGRIGKVEVDHGKTSCKTPDAAAYIKKASAKGRGRRRQSVC